MPSIFKKLFKKSSKPSTGSPTASVALDLNTKLRGLESSLSSHALSMPTTHRSSSSDEDPLDSPSVSPSPSRDSTLRGSPSTRGSPTSSPQSRPQSRPQSLSRIDFAGLDSALQSLPAESTSSRGSRALSRSPSTFTSNAPPTALTQRPLPRPPSRVQQTLDLHTRKVDLLRHCLREELDETRVVLHFSCEKSKPELFKHFVKILVARRLHVSEVALYQICVCVAQRVLEYLFADCRGSEKDLLLLSRRLHRLAGALVDADCALSPSRDNVRAVLRAALGEEHDAAQDEREKEQEQEQEEDMLHTATAQLLVSLALDVAKIASKQLPSSLGVPDLDARVSRALCEHDFNVDDVQILPVKTNFSSVIERSKALSALVVLVEP